MYVRNVTAPFKCYSAILEARVNFPNYVFHDLKIPDHVNNLDCKSSLVQGIKGSKDQRLKGLNPTCRSYVRKRWTE